MTTDTLDVTAAVAGCIQRVAHAADPDGALHYAYGAIDAYYAADALSIDAYRQACAQLRAAADARRPAQDPAAALAEARRTRIVQAANECIGNLKIADTLQRLHDPVYAETFRRSAEFWSALAFAEARRGN